MPDAAAAPDRTRTTPRAIVVTPPRWLQFSRETTAMVIVTLLWLRWAVPNTLNSILGDKRFVPIGEAVPTAPVAELAGRIVFVVLLGACAAVLVYHLDRLTQVGIVRLAVFIAPWAYLVGRDAYLGLVQPEAPLFILLVLSLATLRPGLATLRWIGVLVGLTAILCLAFGILAPEAGILREPDGEMRNASKALIPDLGLLQGIYTSENSMAQVLALGAPLVFLVQPRWLRNSLLVSIVAAVLWSSSRGGMAALAVAFAAVGLGWLLRAPHLRSLLSSCLIAASAGAAVLCVWVPLQPWPPDAFTYRASIWQSSLAYWRDGGTWFGLGTNFYERIATMASSTLNDAAYQGHNIFVQLLTTGGIVLFLLVAVWFVAIMLALLNPQRARLSLAGATLAVIPAAGILEPPLGFVTGSNLWPVTIVPLAIMFFGMEETSVMSAPDPHGPRHHGAPLHDATRKRAYLAIGILTGIVTLVATFGISGALDGLNMRGLFRQPAPTVPVPSDPYSDRPLYVDPTSQTMRAAQEDTTYAELARVPQAKWFTDWSTSATIEQDLGTYLTGATARRELAVVVLYRIPDRDCGSHARGGATSLAEYRAWIDGAAKALRKHRAIVVLEPDALAQLHKCGQGRVALLREATEALSATGAWVYVDAGHSDWHPPSEIAERLKDVGVAHARGFSTNVSNFRPTEDERAYADRVVAELDRLGIPERRYVVDTSRNGGSTQDLDRCNPPGARLGAHPELIFDGAFDAQLWIKSPGESDGTCHGGPRTGFWDQLALMLMGQDNMIEATP